MDNIVKRLKAYVDKHPFDSGNSDCETVLDQLYQAYEHKAFLDGLQYGAHLMQELQTK